MAGAETSPLISSRADLVHALARGGKPKSLGLVASADRSALKLASGADTALKDVPMLAVSLEPKGGSPTGSPTGPVLYSGPCIKDW